jgi:hypothetical protein
LITSLALAPGDETGAINNIEPSAVGVPDLSAKLVRKACFFGNFSALLTCYLVLAIGELREGGGFSKHLV